MSPDFVGQFCVVHTFTGEEIKQSRDESTGFVSFLAKHIRYELSYKRVCKISINLRGRKLGIKPSYKWVLFDDIFLTFILALPIMNHSRSAL